MPLNKGPAVIKIARTEDGGSTFEVHEKIEKIDTSPNRPETQPHRPAAGEKPTRRGRGQAAREAARRVTEEI
jgi:hypothetical protein